MNYPIILTPSGKYEAILHHAYNINVEDQLLSSSEGYETLTFMLSNYDRKRRLLSNEQTIELQNRRYVVRVIEDLKNNSNVCTVTCDAEWYDLNDGELKKLMYKPPQVFKWLNTEGSVMMYPECDYETEPIGVFESRSEALIIEEREEVDKYDIERVWYRINFDNVNGWVLASPGMTIRTIRQTYTIEPLEAVQQQLEGTDWTVGSVTVEGSRPGHYSENVETSLHNLRQISANFGGDLYFDTVNRTVSLLSNMGIRHQKVFCYERNTTMIRRTTDTRNLFTRYTLIGKDEFGNDVTVSDINGGKDYVENFDWYDSVGRARKIKWYRATDDRWSDKENMLAHMKNWIETYSKPSVSYELNVSLFDVSPNLGDYVFVKDIDLGIEGWLRVVSRKKNVLEPHKSTVQLESTKLSIVKTIVATQSTSQQVQDIVSSVITPNNEIKLPTGVEDWVMQYKDGQWKASNVIGNINSILDALNGEVL